MRRLHVVAFLLSLLILSGCGVSSSGDHPNRNYRQDMRNLVQGISNYAKTIKPGFIVIPQNGVELLTANGEADGTPVQGYLDAIDGVGQEDLYYGYDNDNEPTPASETNYLLGFLNVARSHGKRVLVTDYCSTHIYMDDSYTKNTAKHDLSFAADYRELDEIPDYPNPIHNQNQDTIDSLTDAFNFLYLINPDTYGSSAAFVDAVHNSGYDIVLVDAFFGKNQLTTTQIDSLRTKPGGNKRLVIAYLSIGEAENYRYYWQVGWKPGNPSWLEKENPDWPGNYKVRYWDPAWQSIIYGNNSSYLKKIIDAGFDGVYLDIIDAFEYFE